MKDLKLCTATGMNLVCKAEQKRSHVESLYTWFHVYKIQKQAKLNSFIRTQGAGYSWRGRTGKGAQAGCLGSWQCWCFHISKMHWAGHLQPVLSVYIQVHLGVLWVQFQTSACSKVNDTIKRVTQHFWFPVNIKVILTLYYICQVCNRCLRKKKWCTYLM